MGENRSFDNLLGYLYTKENLPEGQDFDGLDFGDYENTSSDGTTVSAHVYDGPTDRIMTFPDPDPGEECPHVNTQIFGTIEPAGNFGIGVGQMAHPYNMPQHGEQPTMGGFLEDYISSHGFVYSAIRTSATPDGSNAVNTLLLIPRVKNS